MSNHVDPLLAIKVPIGPSDEPVKIRATEDLLNRGVFHAFKGPNQLRAETGCYLLDVDYVIFLTNT